MNPPPDFPKLRSLFLRDAQHHVTPQCDPDCEWAITDLDTYAVDKLDGTNICLAIVDGIVCDAYNRTHRRWPLFRARPLSNDQGPAWYAALAEGITSAITRGFFTHLPDGYHYGELIGPTINGNRHRVDQHIWVPFSYLRDNCYWAYAPRDFSSASAVLRNLQSLFELRILRRPPSTVPLAEGLVFTHPDGRMCKLRRDMFDWSKVDENAVPCLP